MIKPAMTAEEWAKRETPVGKPCPPPWTSPEGQVFMDRQYGVCVAGGGTFYSITNPHGTAAFCLHNQPFGFTREHVRALEHHLMRSSGNLTPDPYSTREDCLAMEAIENMKALLPPEGEP